MLFLRLYSAFFFLQTLYLIHI
uniref:Uncharacterized protein n=1 Tax=Lepeophtheirus salmonis TaxID=72036 RepID=A0A0K2TUK8_LEPSM